MISFVILTFNEEIHIERAIRSASLISDDIHILDCFSTDSTVEIASRFSVNIHFRKFDSYSAQLNYAFSTFSFKYPWIFRLDADEYLNSALSSCLLSLDLESFSYNGFYILRSFYFLGSYVRFGGVNRVPTLRLFRLGAQYVENRLMDEHICVSGSVATLRGELIDHSLSTFSQWVSKHGRYAQLEARSFLESSESPTVHSMQGLSGATKVGLKSFYYRLPIFFRALGIYFFRLIFRFGALDTGNAAYFHILQCLWYRLLVDVEIFKIQTSRKSLSSIRNIS